jgi:hypothetical protein
MGSDQDPPRSRPAPASGGPGVHTSPVELLVTEPPDEARGGGALVPQLSDHVHARIGFAHEFAHISDNAARVADQTLRRADRLSVHARSMRTRSGAWCRRT